MAEGRQAAGGAWRQKRVRQQAQVGGEARQITSRWPAALRARTRLREAPRLRHAATPAPFDAGDAARAAAARALCAQRDRWIMPSPMLPLALPRCSPAMMLFAPLAMMPAAREFAISRAAACHVARAAMPSCLRGLLRGAGRRGRGAGRRACCCAARARAACAAW